MNKKIIWYQIIIAVSAALLFIPFIGQLHLFDWDEINFAESAREMILTHDYLTVKIYFQPFWEKPPLFIWMQVLSMKLFGINEFAARFPNAICGIVTLLVLFNVGKSINSTKFGIIWVIAYTCSILPFFYFKSGIIDPWFNLFIFLGVFYWSKALYTQIIKYETCYLILSALFLGLAVLTKGPAAIVIFSLTVGIILIFEKFKLSLKFYNVGLFLLILSLVSGFWFLLQIINGNFQIVKEFIVYQIRLFQTKDAGHGGFPLYHFVVLLVGVFPASVFVFQAHRYKGESNYQQKFHRAMIILFWVVLILFSIVKTKIIHYSSLCYFPMTYLAAYSVHQIIESRFKFTGFQKSLLILLGSILSSVVIFLPLLVRYKNWFIAKGWVTHSFTIGNLQANTGWGWWHSLVGLSLLVGILLLVFSKRNNRFRLNIVFISSLVFINGIVLFLTPGAEKISQNVAIEFFKDAGKKDVYVHSFYKSYARLFYTQQPAPTDTLRLNDNWLMNGNIDKDVFSVARIDKKKEVLRKHSQFKVMYEKNGYVFLVRHPVNKN